MKNLLVLTLAAMLVISMTGVGFAGMSESNMEEGLENSPVLEEGEYSWEHEK